MGRRRKGQEEWKDAVSQGGLSAGQQEVAELLGD